MKYIKSYLASHEIDAIIVWAPYDLYWIDTRQLDKTHVFFEKLQSIFPKYDCIMQDERFSSLSANEGTTKHRDDIAAQVILQSYIDSISK